MSATPGRIEACNNCDYQDTVCPADCEIYQDLRAEYYADVEHDKRKDDRMEERFYD